MQLQIGRRLPQGLRDAVTTIKYDFRNNWASFIDFLVHISPVSGWHDHKVYFPYLFLCLWTLKLTSRLWLGERSKSLELVWQCLHALVSNIGLICLEKSLHAKKVLTRWIPLKAFPYSAFDSSVSADFYLYHTHLYDNRQQWHLW